MTNGGCLKVSKSVHLSVRPSVGPSVSPSVSNAFVKWLETGNPGVVGRVKVRTHLLFCLTNLFALFVVVNI